MLDNSPCIDSGDPALIDLDGSISDVGANIYNQNNCLIPGDLNNDGTIDVLDVIASINIFIICEGEQCFESSNVACIDSADLNGDNIVNVLDIVLMVNIIIN